MACRLPMGLRFILRFHSINHSHVNSRLYNGKYYLLLFSWIAFSLHPPCRKIYVMDKVRTISAPIRNMQAA
jgi:hypothetical protein